MAKPNTQAPKSTQEMKSLVSRLVNQKLTEEAEPKYLYDSSGTSAQTFTSSGSIRTPTAIAQGVSNNQRIGDKVKLIELEIFYRLVVGTSPDAIRFIVWVDKQISDPAAPPSALFPLYYTPAADYQTAMSPLDHKLRQVITIKKDWLTSLSSNGGGATNGNILVGKMVIPLNLTQVYTGSNSPNQVYISLIGEGAPANSYVLQTRLKFIDI